MEAIISEFHIQGGKKLQGTIKVCGAKNAAIKMIAASILIPGEVILHNVPDILDISKFCEILVKMGAKISRSAATLKINTSNLQNINPDPILVRSMRASIVLVGPLLARFGQAIIPHPGGDKIGSRPIDRHLKVFQDLGVKIEYRNQFYTFRAGEILTDNTHFSKISVTGTENVLLYLANQNKEVKIANSAIEPEVIDLINFLIAAGAKIKVFGRTISIQGNLHLKPVEYQVIPDRIEAGTLAVLAAATGSEIKITHCRPDHLAAFLTILSKIGVKFEKGNDFLYIKKSDNLKSCDITTGEYPNLPTDLQPPLGLLLTQTRGKSTITEKIFENRLGYLEALVNMGARVKIIDRNSAEITGPTKLRGAKIPSLDIRAGATLIIAGLLAQGQTIIKEAENIDRGYERIEERLAKIGAKIQRVR